MNFVQPIREKAAIEAMKNELAKSGTRDKLLFLMGINTGLRISDLLTLKVSDVRNQDYYTLKEKKTGKTRRINLHAVKDEIAAFTATSDEDDYLFRSRNGKNSPISRVQAYRILNGAAAAVGLEEVGTHTLRKTFGYHFYKQYKDVAALQRILNHSSPSETLRYIGITQEEIDEMTSGFFL